jgi:hypothetical protein
MDSIKNTVSELSVKEQDELILFIMQNRSGKKTKLKKDPDAPKRELTDGQKAWTDNIKNIQTIVNRLVPTDTKFKYKQAMSVASALKKAETAVTDSTVLKFYREWMATRPADSSSEVEAPAAAAPTAALATPKKAKAKPAAVAATPPPAAAPTVAPGAPKKKAAKKPSVVAGAPYKGTWTHDGVEYDRDDCAIYSLDGDWVGIFNPVTNTIVRVAEEPESNWS